MNLVLPKTLNGLDRDRLSMVGETSELIIDIVSRLAGNSLD